jgi:hypothetical protein
MLAACVDELFAPGGFWAHESPSLRRHYASR